MNNSQITKDAQTKASTANNGYTVGDVFQITDVHGRNGWIGAFVMATVIKSWGIQGFVSQIETHDEQRRAYIRLNWNEIEYVGHAVLIPQDETV